MNVVQPHVIQKCNRYIGGLDQLDGFLINMRPAIDGRKWYQMQMNNYLRFLQVGAYRFHVNLGHQTSKLNFLGDIVDSHVTQRQSLTHVTFVPRMNDMEVKHYLNSVTQGRCRHCRKNQIYVAKLVVFVFIKTALLTITKPEHFCNMGQIQFFNNKYKYRYK